MGLHGFPFFFSFLYCLFLIFLLYFPFYFISFHVEGLGGLECGGGLWIGSLSVGQLPRQNDVTNQLGWRRGYSNLQNLRQWYGSSVSFFTNGYISTGGCYCGCASLVMLGQRSENSFTKSTKSALPTRCFFYQLAGWDGLGGRPAIDVSCTLHAAPGVGGVALLGRQESTRRKRRRRRRRKLRCG